MVDKTDKKEQTGYHKGSLDVLMKEREELMRVLGIVEQIMHMHAERLKELGVDMGQDAWATPKGTTKQIDELM